MKTRTDLLNHLAEKYNLHRYLEIGVQVPALNFDKIKCPIKIGVDPDPSAKATFEMTSDSFFDEIIRWNHWPDFSTLKPENGGSITEFDSGDICTPREDKLTIPTQYDLIFIDGLHTAEQVKIDFENALKILSPNGFIVLHDCNPLKEEHTIVPRPTPRGSWNGDVYRFASTIPKNHYYTVDIDNGTGVFQNVIGVPSGFLRNRPNWQAFNENRKELLNLITWEEFVKL